MRYAKSEVSKCPETAAIVSGCCLICLVLSCVVYSLFYLALVSCEIVCMDLSDVERLDGVLAEGAVGTLAWMSPMHR
jgi:hypothetical protein